jgi:hypothetical protein
LEGIDHGPAYGLAFFFVSIRIIIIIIIIIIRPRQASPYGPGMGWSRGVWDLVVK